MGWLVVVKSFLTCFSKTDNSITSVALIWFTFHSHLVDWTPPTVWRTVCVLPRCGLMIVLIVLLGAGAGHGGGSRSRGNVKQQSKHLWFFSWPRVAQMCSIDRIYCVLFYGLEAIRLTGVVNVWIDFLRAHDAQLQLIVKWFFKASRSAFSVNRKVFMIWPHCAQLELQLIVKLLIFRGHLTPV